LVSANLSLAPSFNQAAQRLCSRSYHSVSQAGRYMAWNQEASKYTGKQEYKENGCRRVPTLASPNIEDYYARSIG